MRHFFLRFPALQVNIFRASLFTVACSFIFGVAVGCHSAMRVCPRSELFAPYLDSFLLAARLDTLIQPSYLDVIWRGLRWPLAALILGFFPLGLIGLPLLSLLRSFFLSFSVTAWSIACGRAGFELSVILFGFTAILEIPIFIILCMFAVSSSWLALRMSGAPAAGRSARKKIVAFGICLGSAILHVILELRVVPSLLMSLVETIAS